MSGKRVLVGFSGGVDSCAAVYLLKQKGYEVTAIHLILHEPEQHGASTDRLKTITRHLHVPLVMVNRQDLFQKTIIEAFVKSYLSGETPNPCTSCNEEIKLQTLRELMPVHKASWIATGHYAKKVLNKESQQWTICRGADRAKDQSYFLSLVTQKNLRPLLLPLGDKTKRNVKALAHSLLPAVPKDTESHEICFLKGSSYIDFLVSYLEDPARKGTFVNADGEVLGTHNGTFRFTIGQRRGIGIPDRTPYYVTALHPETNQVQIGKISELYQSTFTVRECRWHIPPGEDVISVNCQIRYRHPTAAASVRILTSDRAEVTFLKPQRAITPGQIAAFYRNDCLVGAGIIEKVGL